MYAKQRLKRFLAVITIFCAVFCGFSYGALADTEIKVYVNGEKLSFDAEPRIYGGRTLVPLRGVFSALGAKVDWDEKDYVINVTSRAYSRYLRDMGVEGAEVVYPLADGEVSFDQKKEPASEETYDAKKALPALSLSADKASADVGDTVDIYVNLSNMDKAAQDALLTTMTVTMKYDSSKLSFAGYKLEKDGEEYAAVMDATNGAFLNDSLKIVAITNLGLEETEPTKDGAIAKVSFEVLSDEPTEIALSARRHPSFGMDTTISLKSGDKNITYAEANEIFVDTNPIMINAK